MLHSGIYQIRNILNNNIYVGSSINLRKRKNRHFSELALNKHYNSHLQSSYNKYGKNNFIFEILLICDSKYLEWYEQLIVDNWNPEYNQRTKVNSNYGIKRTKEYKDNVGNFFRGKNITKTHKKNISLSNRYKKYSNKTGFRGVQKISKNSYRSKITLNGKQVHLGCFPTPEKASSIYQEALSKYLSGEGG